MQIISRGIPIEVQSAQTAASLRLSEMREEAHKRAAALMPGGVWTTGLSVVLVALSQRPLGTMTVARAQSIIENAEAIWSALLSAESLIEETLNDTSLSEAEKVAIINATQPQWPETQT